MCVTRGASWAVLGLFLSACGILSDQVGAIQKPTLDSMETAAVMTLAVKLSQLTPSASPLNTPTQTLDITNIVPPITPTEPQTSTEPPPPLTATIQVISPNVQILGCNKAELLTDLTIPDDTILSAGFEFTKSWRLQNSGSCVWEAGYSLVFSGGDLMGATGGVSLNQNVESGGFIDLSVNLIAPQQSGSYQGNWMLKTTGGQVFGIGPNGDLPFWVKVKISNTEISNTEISNSPSPVPTPGSGVCQVSGDQQFESELLKLINQERAKQGLYLLLSQSQLVNTARVHSQDMACKDVYDHIGSDGSTPFDRIKTQRYVYSEASESIFHDASKESTPSDVIQVWLANPQDQANLLNGVYTQIGVGYKKNSGNTTNGYLTVIFARP